MGSYSVPARQLQLMPEEIHKSIGHTGGFTTWYPMD
jgi:hypothetical protein